MTRRGENGFDRVAAIKYDLALLECRAGRDRAPSATFEIEKVVKYYGFLTMRTTHWYTWQFGNGHKSKATSSTTL